MKINRTIEEVSEVYIERSNDSIVETSNAAIEIVRLRSYVVEITYAVLDYDARGDSDAALETLKEAIEILKNSNVVEFDEIQAYITFLELIQEEIETEGVS